MNTPPPCADTTEQELLYCKAQNEARLLKMQEYQYEIDRLRDILASPWRIYPPKMQVHKQATEILHKK